MGERLGGVGHDGWEMRHELLACEMLLDGQNYLVGAYAHMIPGAVGQHQCLSISSCFSIAVSNKNNAHLPSKQPGTTEK
jgi:hypothetical protein